MRDVLLSYTPEWFCFAGAMTDQAQFSAIIERYIAAEGAAVWNLLQNTSAHRSFGIRQETAL
jgi:hypothetical protein